MFNGKSILVTGGTGTFGKAFTKYLLKNFLPSRLVVFSRDEYKQYLMQQEVSNSNLRFFIGDVRDKERLARAMYKIDYVVHAAAFKQVVAAEYNPIEAIKTNIIGAQNIVEVSADSAVKKVVALSTDKAVNPVNLYGATKLAADKLFVAANSYAGGRGTSYSVVRYGNVLGSRGSVLNLFLKQKEQGELQLTSREMTRFWITVSHAVSFVKDALRQMHGGEIFVPKIPSMNMLDFATALAPLTPIREIGIRPGEKLHEVMISADDASNTYEFENYYIIMPAFISSNKISESWKKVEIGFSYDSKTNPHKLEKQELLKIIKEGQS